MLVASQDASIRAEELRWLTTAAAMTTYPSVRWAREGDSQGRACRWEDVSFCGLLVGGSARAAVISCGMPCVQLKCAGHDSTSPYERVRMRWELE